MLELRIEIPEKSPGGFECLFWNAEGRNLRKIHFRYSQESVSAAILAGESFRYTKRELRWNVYLLGTFR